MSLKDVVEQYDGSLTPADRQLAEVLLSDPQESSYLSAEAIAKRAGVHQSAASRLAQKLGFGSFRELRAALRKDVMSAGTSAERIRKRLDHFAEKSILQALVESEIRALSTAVKQVDQEQMERAAECLRDAGRIVLFGQGHAASLVDLFERRLMRSGYHARALRHGDWQAPDVLLSLKAGDALVAFALRPPFDRLDRVLTHAAAVGATSIMVSDVAGLLLRPRADIVIAASRGEEGESQSLTVPMAVCNALILELSRCDDGHSIRSLEGLDALRHLFDAGERVPEKRGTSAPKPKNSDR
jgi:DNA-binding MurR/RpiR family transcriptional regulator